MTIRFLQQWNGYDDQDIVTLSATEESRLVGLGIATFKTQAEKSASNSIGLVGSVAEIPSAQGVYQVGGQLFISGTDGKAASPKNNTTNTVKVARIGDSTASIYSGESPLDVAGVATATNDASYVSKRTTTANFTTSKNFQNIALECLYPAVEYVTDCGVGGRSNATLVTDEQSASTLSTRKVIDCTNSDPDVIIFSGASINDFMSAGYSGGVINETNYQTYVTNYKTVVQRLLTLGPHVIAWGVLGFSKGLTGFVADANATATRNALLRFNAEIASWANSLNNERLAFINPLGLLHDSTGAFYSGYVPSATDNSQDGIHLGFKGGMVLGQKEADIITGWFGKSRKYKWAGKNVQTNPMFANVSSGLPTSYVLSNGTNTSLGVAAVLFDESVDALFATRTVTVNADGEAGFYVSLPWNPTASGTNPLNVVANDVYGFEFDFKVENLTTGYIEDVRICQNRFYIFNSNNTNFFYFDNLSLYHSGGTFNTAGQIDGALRLHVATPRIKFQNNAASYGFDINSQNRMNITIFARAGNVIRFGIANPRIVKLS